MKLIGLLVLSLGFPVHAELNFISYLKRNHQVINGNRTEVEKVAFKEKQRSIASVPEEVKPADAPKSPPPAEPSEPTEASAPPEPNR